MRAAATLWRFAAADLVGCSSMAPSTNSSTSTSTSTSASASPSPSPSSRNTSHSDGTLFASGMIMSRALRPTVKNRSLAYGVHLLTASGIIPASFAMMEIIQPDCDPRIVFVWLLLATFIDAIDGPLARRFHVKQFAGNIDGRTIDDLIDYLTFAFIPLVLVWRMEWLPDGWGWTVVLAMAASLLGFSHCNAKDETNGFFRGFPSYWNVFALYAGIFTERYGPWWTAGGLWLLTILTVSPVWFVYPNLAPPTWKPAVQWGALTWTICMIGLLVEYPSPPLLLILVSLVYPIFYAGLSFHLSKSRR